MKKLHRMGPREIAGRITGEFRIRRLQYATRRAPQLIAQFKIPVDTVTARCTSLVPGTAKSEQDRLKLEFPTLHESIVNSCQRRGQQIAQGELKLLGKQVSITPSMDWHSDPSTGFTWSGDFFSRVSYHKIPEQVDFKDIWELGRQQYVVELSRSCLAGGDQSHGELARDMMLSWIDGNPFCHGIHWTSGLEVGVRAISWIWSLANLRDFQGWRPGEQERIIDSLGLHAFYLENHFSYYSSPYNHIIGEAAGLYLIATVLRGSSHATRWRRLASRTLTDFGPRQFYRDGFCVEQAMGYHYFTLGFLMLAQLAANSVGDTDLQLEELMRHALRSGLIFRQPNGNWPMIGDVDSAQSIPVARDNYWDFSAVHQLAAAAFNDSTIACSAQDDRDVECEDELFWLLGCDGIQQFRGIQSEPNSMTKLASAGYYVASNKSDYVLLDAGSISHGLFPDSTPSAAHGHADTLQVIYQLNGREVLCDCGMPNYAGNLLRADYFRSPQAHNTVSFEGAELVRPAGGLAWSNEVQTPKLLTAAGDHPLFMASGEVQWPTCRITRNIMALPGEALWIADHLQSEEPRTANWYWQFPFQVAPKLQSSENSIVVGGSEISVRSVGTNNLRSGKIISRNESTTAGWVSPGYGVVNPAHRLSYSCNVDGSLLVLTCIGDPKQQVGFESDGNTLALDPSESKKTSSASLADAGTSHGWQRHKSPGQGCWLIKS